jgi:trans-aconitate methyltransferase
MVVMQETVQSQVESLAKLTNAFRTTGVICAAAQLGLPDLVDCDGAKPCELAEKLSCDADALYRLLRTLASLGIFEETDTGRFIHTPASQLLRKDAEPSLHGLACLIGQIDVFVWPHILYSIRTGKAAFDKVFGTGIFDYMKEHAEISEPFDRAMAGFTEVVATEVIGAYDFGQYRHVIDIGGGNGTLLKKILGRYPQVRGTIYDIDHVVERALEKIPGTQWEGRLDGIPGDFLQFVPPGGDLYVIKIVLCDWSDDHVRTILSNVRKVIGKGRLLIIDGILPPGNAPSFAKLSDINMLVLTGSRERTEKEFRELLSSTSFRLNSVHLVHEWVGLLEAVAET